MEAITKNLRLTMLVLIGAGLVFAYPLSVISMDHEINAVAAHHTPLSGHSVIPEQPMSDTESCVDFHLSMLRGITECLPKAENTSIPIAVLTATFFIFTLTYFNLITASKRINYQYQRLKSVSLTAFIVSLGFWLTTIEKKAPAYAFATA